MTEHTHAWSPIQGAVAQYACTCSATGYRNQRGVIVEHRTRKAVRAAWTAQPTSPHRANERDDYDWDGSSGSERDL